MSDSTRHLRTVTLPILRHPKMSKGNPEGDIYPTEAAKAPAVGCNYAAFFRDFYPVVLKFLVRAGINTSFAEDPTQEAFLTAYDRRSDVRVYNASHSWVCTVALRRARRYLKLQRSHIPLDHITGPSLQDYPFVAEDVMSVLQRFPTPPT
jgi:DNA-directed RNA polymerase specialized sigma24 family protein